MDQADIPSLLARLQSDEDAVRKMAVFKLQSSINDPSFADVYISSGGLNVLRRLIMATGGNTLAYSLQSLSRLLEVDMGWEIFEISGGGELVERLVELIVTHPLVNILRGAMSILVAVVSHPQNGREKIRVPAAFGFRALKPAIAVHPTFFAMVVAQLNSADHALCANALSLLNALLRDSLQNDGGYVKDEQGKNAGMVEEWPKFVKRLQDMGVVNSVYFLMQGSALQDLAHPLLDFQALTKELMRKWRDVKVDLERPDHRRALKAVHHSSAPPDKIPYANGTPQPDILSESSASGSKKGSRRHNPEKWRRLGFETENPAWEFDHMGYLGMMDLNYFISKQEDGYQKLLLEQSTKPMNERCPVARASLAVTLILYEHFEIDKSDVQDAKSLLVLDGMKNYDLIFKPLILQWSKVHIATLQAFFQLWKATGAGQDDFEKVADLVRILVDHVVGQSSRNQDVSEVEEELVEFDYGRLREMQMQLLEMSFDGQWGHLLQDVRQQLKDEALQFMREQRIRCLLQGSWFILPGPDDELDDFDNANSLALSQRAGPAKWRYVKLSHNRHFLHFHDFESQTPPNPTLDDLPEKINLNDVRTVASSMKASEINPSNSSKSTLKTPSKPNPQLQITINTFAPMPKGSKEEPIERPLLVLYPENHTSGSEWLDGLLMLLGQAPITAETKKLIDFIKDYGLKIRLLNVRLEDGVDDPWYPEEAGVVPDRMGLDEDYYYEV